MTAPHTLTPEAADRTAQDVPEWAKSRACQLANQEPLTNWRLENWSDGTFIPASMVALARYIAAHEEPPVDPLLIEARELVARTNHDQWPDSPWHLNEAQELRSGGRDFTLVLQAAHNGLRRGIELAKEQGK